MEYKDGIGGSSTGHVPKLDLVDWKLFSNNDIEYVFQNFQDLFL